MEIVAEDLAPKKPYTELVELARDDQVGFVTGSTKWWLSLSMLLLLL